MTTTTNNLAPSRAPGRVAPGAAVLWASAMVILALTLTSASRLTGFGVASAGNVSEKGSLVVLTAAAGNSEDVLLALDSRADRLLAYTVRNGQTLELRGTYKISDLFKGGRQMRGRSR